VKYSGPSGTGDGQEEEDDEIPVLSVVLHPFKESRAISFSEKEKLFGIHANRIDPSKDIQVIELNKPLELFAPMKIKTKLTVTSTETEKEEQGKETEEDDNIGIITPTFNDFFDETFLNHGQNDSKP
jgi:hypothetical protein